MQQLNAIDIITGLVVLWAVVAGWRRGIILQLCSLAGIVVSLYLAARYGSHVGTWLRFGPAWAAPGGFLVVALITLILVNLAGHLFRKIFRFAGLGVLDILLGIAISLVKWLLLLGALYSVFGSLNRTAELVDAEALEGSRTFRPVCRLSESVLPFMKQALTLPDWEEWLPETEKNETNHDRT